MAEFINPVPCFEDLVHVFEEGGRTVGGINLDEDLCRIMAEVMTEAAEGVAVLVEFARSQGLVQSIDVPEAPTLTPVQRQQLARNAIALDPQARVIAFPRPAVRQVAMSEGGTAA